MAPLDRRKIGGGRGGGLAYSSYIYIYILYILAEDRGFNVRMVHYVGGVMDTREMQQRYSVGLDFAARSVLP